MDQQERLSNLIREYDEKYTSVSMTRNAPMSALLFYDKHNSVEDLQASFSSGYTDKNPSDQEGSLGPYPIVINSLMEAKRPIIHRVASTSGVHTVHRFGSSKGTSVKTIQIEISSSVPISDLIHFAYKEVVKRFRNTKQHNFMKVAIKVLGSIVCGVISSYTINMTAVTNGMINQSFTLIVTDIYSTTGKLVPDTDDYKRYFSMDESVISSAGGENYLEVLSASPDSPNFSPVKDTLVRDVLIQNLEMTLTAYVGTFYTSMGFSVVLMNYGMFNGSLSVKVLQGGGVTQGGSSFSNLYNNLLHDYRYLHLHMRVGSLLRDYAGIVTNSEDSLQGGSSSSKMYTMSLDNIMELDSNLRGKVVL